jgi:hypothetical protein
MFRHCYRCLELGKVVRIRVSNVRRGHLGLLVEIKHRVGVAILV